jgi:hypothetical protein
MDVLNSNTCVHVHLCACAQAHMLYLDMLLCVENNSRLGCAHAGVLLHTYIHSMFVLYTYTRHFDAIFAVYVWCLCACACLVYCR